MEHGPRLIGRVEPWQQIPQTDVDRQPLAPTSPAIAGPELKSDLKRLDAPRTVRRERQHGLADDERDVAFQARPAAVRDDGAADRPAARDRPHPALSNFDGKGRTSSAHWSNVPPVARSNCA